MCTRCRNATYGYHITDRKFLASINKSGLSPLVVRTGSWTASDSGSFARDRAVKLPGKIEARIAGVVASAMNAGLSKEAIIAGPLRNMPVTIDIPVTGSTQDNVHLEDELAAGLKLYGEELADGSAPASVAAPSSGKGVKPVRARVARVTARDARPVAAQLPRDHYLVRLATSYEEWRSVIEEKITGQHVYFFVSNHKAVYEKYLKLCGAPEDVAFLRVRLCNLAGHEADDSDGDAIMT
ncbi:MAG: hypothetical protein JF619_28965, partial [Massilia sp.]|nr:hypothetical protein [Massilia sp.]